MNHTSRTIASQIDAYHLPNLPLSCNYASALGSTGIVPVQLPRPVTTAISLLVLQVRRVHSARAVSLLYRYMIPTLERRGSRIVRTCFLRTIPSNSLPRLRVRSRGPFTGIPFGLLLRRSRCQLESVNPTHCRHFVLEQRIHYAVPGRLHLGLERVGDDGDAEVGFFGCAALHGFVVGVQVGVVEDLQGCWMESFLDLWQSRC
jgi:hypothetical protein